MSPTLIELNPNQSLLDSNFDGYKLSLQEIPRKKREFASPVDRVILNTNQYSLLHAKLFGLHNHLVGDSFDENCSVYFVDNEWNVNKIYIDPLSDELIEPVKVWQVPKNRNRKAGDYNVSIKFISPNFAVVGDGTGLMYIIDTGCRENDDGFSECFSDEVAGQNEPFVIVDATFNHSKKAIQELHVLLLCIKQDKSNERFSTVLHWITLTNKDGRWGQVALKQLKSSGNVQYAALEKSCEAVYVVSDAECKFTLNSDYPVQKESEPPTDTKKAYKWSQDIEDISIKVTLPENFSKDAVSVHTEPTEIEIKYDSASIVSGQLQQRIDSDSTTWTIEQNVLEVSLCKEEGGIMWTELVKNDTTGEQILDSCIVEQVHEKLANLCNDGEALPQAGITFNIQQVEECDFEGDKSTAFERLSGTTNSASHKINLGSRQVLISANLNSDLPPALGIRHDVDVCLWQPRGNSESFSITHEGTLLAFGYVQASKQNRKFSVCPPDCGYSIVCESSGHIFIYRQNKPISSSELRNRSTGRRIHNIAEQQVINIPNEEILGIYPYNSILFLVCEKSITALKL